MATDLTAERKSLEKELSSSKTALGANTPPTQRDITIAKQLATIKSREAGAKDIELQKAWYGTDKGESAPLGTAVSKPPKGVLQRALSTLAMPLGAVVGTAETVLGKGQSKSLYQNVKKSIEEQHTFGDLLRQYGAGDKTALIGGLALDIALDPINWATMGAEAFIPRIAYGAKAGLEGVKAGAKSVGLDVLKKAAYPLKYFGGESARLVPKVAGEAVETAVKTAKEVAPEVGRELGVSGAQAAKELSEGAMELVAGTGAKGLRQKVVNAALKAKADYNALTGRTMEELLSKPSLIGGTRIGDLVLSKVNALKGVAMKPGWMQRAGEFFAYDPQRVFQNRLANMAEAVNMRNYLQEEGGNVWNYSKAQLLKSKIVQQSDFATRMIEGGELSSDLNQKLIELVSQGSDMPATRRKEILDDLVRETTALKQGGASFPKIRTENASKEAADLATVAAKESRIVDPELRAKALNQEFWDNFFLKKSLADLKSIGVSEKQMSSMISALRQFKQEGTGWLAFDRAMQKFSNLWIIKDKLKGEQILNGYKNFIELFKGTKIGQLSSTMLSMLNNAVMTHMYGINFYDPAFLKELKLASGAALRAMGSKGSGSSISLVEWMMHPEIQKFATDYPDLFHDIFKVRPELAASPSATIAAATMKMYEKLGLPIPDKKELKRVQEQLVKEWIAAGVVPEALDAMDTTFISREMGKGKAIQRAANWAKDPANADNILAKIVDLAYNKPLELFETADQSYKMGLFSHLVKNGLTDSEMIRVNRYNPINLKTDVAQIDKLTGRYKLTGEKAASIANDVYMDYSAMPGAVKVLRNMPLLGMPFASYMYAMLNKMGQTAMYNPSFFNKVQSMLNEINGGRSPLEKRALDSPYYSWMKDYGMVSLPFFRDNPTYMNMASFFPYMTMNIFTPSERQLENTLGGNAVKIIDSLPILKTPEGQTIMDNLIVPLILRDADPTGIFNQPLYPEGASLGKKAAYFARNFAETVMPANLALPMGVATAAIAPGATEYLPSYKWRKVGYALQGKSPLGLQTKEGRLNATTRAITGTYTGIGLYPLNTTYVK